MKFLKYNEVKDDIEKYIDNLTREEIITNLTELGFDVSEVSEVSEVINEDYSGFEFEFENEEHIKFPSKEDKERIIKLSRKINTNTIRGKINYIGFLRRVNENENK